MNKKLMLWILPIILLMSIVGVNADIANWVVPASAATVSSNVNITVSAGNGTAGNNIAGANLSLAFLNGTQKWVNNSLNYTGTMNQISITLPSASHSEGTMSLIVRLSLLNTTVYNTSARTVYIDNLNPTITYTTAPADLTDQSATSSAITISSTEELTSAYIDFGSGRVQLMTTDNNMNTAYSGTITAIPRGSYTWRTVGFEAGTTTEFASVNRQLTISDKSGLVVDENGQVVTAATTPKKQNFSTPIIVFVLIIVAMMFMKKKGS